MIKLEIEGRRIIPIRAIPEITGRNIPPDDIAMILAKKSPRWRPEVSLNSYHCGLDGSFSHVLPRAWDVVIQDLITLRKQLESEQKITDENHQVWRRKSMIRLLPGTFCWWDEFEETHEKLFPKRITKLLNGRPGDRAIDSNPPLSKKLERLIYEGFEHLPSYIDSIIVEGDLKKKQILSLGFPKASNPNIPIVPEPAVQAEETVKKKKRTPGRIKQRKKTEKRYSLWQKEADQLWAMRAHRNKGKSDIARIIANSDVGDGCKWSTIRLHIKKKTKN